MRQKIVDHQITGKQKYAITRNKDRSLDRLESNEDKTISFNLNELCNTAKQLNIPLEKSSVTKPVKSESERALELLLESEKDLIDRYKRALEKKCSRPHKISLLRKLDDRISKVRNDIKEILKGNR
jgi:hypothetical protein